MLALVSEDFYLLGHLIVSPLSLSVVACRRRSRCILRIAHRGSRVILPLRNEGRDGSGGGQGRLSAIRAPCFKHLEIGAGGGKDYGCVGTFEAQ